MTIQIFKGVQNQELVLKADYDKAASFESSLDAALHREKALERKLLSKEADCDKLAAECAALKSAISYVCDTDNLPDYQHEGMGCGIEDRGIIDRYDAARYGWDEAMERIYSEVISFAGDINTTATDAAIAELRAQGVDEFAAVTIAIGEEEEEPSIIYAGKQAKLFAAQLRAGKDGVS